MAQELLTITQEQFGSDRPNRPAPWKPLSPKYQKQIGYYGSPKLILSGDLQSSFSVVATPQMGVVTAHSGYAAAHQFGTRIVPPRPFFPVVDGQLTSYAEKRIAKRAEDTIAKLVVQ
jgi:phage gpG-like protein